MDINYIRDRIFTFFVPVAVVVLVLGTCIGVIGKAYFWDISRLTIQIPGNSPSTVRIDIQARLVYFNIDMFGLFRYPVRIVLPFSRTQTCDGQCTFDRLPQGDASITVLQKDTNTPIQIQIRILPDTKGTIDLRPKFTLTPIPPESLLSQKNSEDIEDISGRLIVSNTISHLKIYKIDTSYVLYDALLGQSFPLPEKGMISHIARGEGNLYLIWYDSGLVFWDRYGQIPTKEIQEILYFGVRMTWSSGETFLEFRGEKKTLEGVWSPIYGEKGTLVTNGEDILRIE